MGADGGPSPRAESCRGDRENCYNEFLAGHWEEAKPHPVQAAGSDRRLLSGVNFPDGFRAGMTLRGFSLG